MRHLQPIQMFVSVSFCLAATVGWLFDPGARLVSGQDLSGQGLLEQDSLQRDYSDQLQRIAPHEINSAIATLEVESGLSVELIASEPMIVDPVAITFDEWGRAYVVEMRGYSERADQLLGRVKRLEDVDRDGCFDKATIFADGFRWPTAVVCVAGGILVGDAPDILFLKDNDGDGRADFRQVVFTGLGTTNVQQLPNSFQWGIDNRIYGASGGNGGQLSRVEFPVDSPFNNHPLAARKTIDVRGRDFKINPQTFGLEAITGGTQFGMTFDQWGTRYVCSNSDHCQQVVFEDRYAARNTQQRIDRSRVSIAVDGPAAEVYRSSPVEPWRKVRTRLRVQGLVGGPIEGGGRAAGYFTSATGICCYDGDRLPAEFRGNLFVGDVGSNLVHRKKIIGDGIQKQAVRTELESEFLRSTDNWFRPVQMANAPDGSLILLDMYRETIEHPASLPPLIKKHLDLNSGNNRGRIYRIVPKTESTTDRLLPGNASLEELVTMLGHANGWHRQTAARVLWEKAQSPELAPRIAESIRGHGLTAEHPVARIRSLYLLSDLVTIPGKELSELLRDPHPQVRVHALRLAQSQLDRELEEQVRTMASDPDVTVRFQVALTIGEFGSETADTIAAMAAQDDSDSWIQMALANSAYRNRGRVIQSLVHNAAKNQGSLQACRPLLLELTGQLARQASDRDLKIVCKVLEEWPLPDEFLKGEFVARLIQVPNPELQKLQMLLQEAGMSLEQIVERAASQATQMAADPSLASQQRVAAIALLRLGQPATLAPVVSELLELSQPPSVKRAAMELAENFETAEMGEAILARFQSFNPALRSTALQVLLAREIWTKQLLEQVESGTISPVLVDAASRQRLVRHRNVDIQARAKNCLGEHSNMDRKRLVEQYLVQVNPSAGDVERGRKVFRKSCVACHRLENEGNEIGPNLAAFANRGTAAMITNILDPNREVDPRFLSFQVQLIDGRILLGVIANESATTIGLQNSEGNTVTILRQEIEAMQSTTLSLMPENFENEINAEAMADLVRYLLSQGS